MVTELIEFKLLENFSNEQLTTEAESVVENFHKKQDGFVDFALIGDITNQLYQMIIHYESMADIEKVKTDKCKKGEDNSVYICYSMTKE